MKITQELRGVVVAVAAMVLAGAGSVVSHGRNSLLKNPRSGHFAAPAVSPPGQEICFFLALCKVQTPRLTGIGSPGRVFQQAAKAWPVPEAARRVVNPVKASPATLAAAKKVYGEVCAQCHGDTGKGDGIEAMMYSVKPANFSDKHMMDQMTDGEIFYKISEGRRPMPSFKNGLSEEQRWRLVHFVRTFAAPAAKSPKKAPNKSSPAHKH